MGAAHKQILLIRSRLGYTRLKAPSAGAISMVSAEAGENITPGKTVAVLSSGGRPEVKVTVPAAYISRIKAGDPVTVTFAALKGKPAAAVVSEVGVTAGKSASTYPVIARLTGAPPDARAGMAAEVTFKLGAPAAVSGRVVVPPVAVSEDRQQKRYVFVAEKKAAGRAVVKRRVVQVGELSTRGLEIRSGLKPGELLITAGVSKIRDGLEVKLLGEKSK